MNPVIRLSIALLMLTPMTLPAMAERSKTKGAKATEVSTSAQTATRAQIAQAQPAQQGSTSQPRAYEGPQSSHQAAPSQPQAPQELSATTTPEVVYGPWLDVSDTSAYVMFKLNYKSLAWVEIAPDDGTAFEAMERPRYYMTASGRRMTADFHAVKIEGLEPGTKYRYRVNAAILLNADKPNNWVYGRHKCVAKEKKFQTMNPGAEICRFTVVNDIHGNDAAMKALVAGIPQTGADFLFINGDQVSYINDIEQFMLHTFTPMEGLERTLPIKYARGNHEGRGSEWFRLSQLFPNKDTGEFYWCFRQGPVAFLILDAGEDKPDNHIEYAGTAEYEKFREIELEWIKKTVREPLFADAPVKIVMSHVPPIKGWMCERWLSENVTPVLNGAGVNLMLSGHKHSHFLVEPGTCGNAFPILVNNKCEAIDCMVDSKGIFISVRTPNGNVVKEYKF